MLPTARRFVGRGGEKLDAALDRFSSNVVEASVLDAGSSTGGFVDCLLQRGARQVVALDVGHGQLDPRLRGDPRVVVMERTNVRCLTRPMLVSAGVGEPVDMVTADLAFISLTTVLPVLAGDIVRPGGALVLLVKPQFEAGRAEASRAKGVIRDAATWLAALRRVATSLDACGAVIIDAMRSPLRGASGNVEFFLHAVAHTEHPGQQGSHHTGTAPEPTGTSGTTGPTGIPGQARFGDRVDEMLRALVEG